MHSLSPRDLAPLLIVEPVRFVWKLVIGAVCLVVGVVGALQTSLLLAAAGAVLLGLVFAHMVELQHQCLHGTAFRRGSVWNRIIGIALGLPMLVSYSHYRHIHLHHHRHLGTPQDREFFGYKYDSLRTLRGFVSHFLLFPHLRTVAVELLSAPLSRRGNGIDNRWQRRIRTEYSFMLGMLALFALLMIGRGSTLPLRLWLLPFVVSLPIHAMIEFPEHFGRDRSCPSVCDNTQTIQANRLLQWFTNGNNFHVEHHSFPGVPNDKLPALHSLIRPAIIHSYTSYARFYIEAFRRLFLPPRQ